VKFTVVLAGALLALTACAQPGVGDTQDGKLTVVATTTQVADFARVVGGDLVSVTDIVKPNIDPHDYEPSAADVAAIAKAAVLVKNGVGLEKWLDETVSSAGFHGTEVDTSKGIAIRDTDDPHIWHNPQNAKLMAATIETAFATADPANASTYEKNFRAYAAQLDQLDKDIAAQIATIPVDQRKLVTNHDAFGYYVDRYHLQFVGAIIPSFDTSAELSAKDVNEIVDKIRATGTKAIFTESSLPPKTAEAIGRQAGVAVVDSLYGDSLGPAGSGGDTYLKMERHNTAVIVQALR